MDWVFLFLLYVLHAYAYMIPCVILTPLDRVPSVKTVQNVVHRNLLVAGPLFALPLLHVFGPDQRSCGSLVASSWHTVEALVMSDLLFYAVHRLLHTKPFNRFHSKHHQWSIDEPFGAFDASVVEHCAGNVFPFIVGSLLAGLQQVELAGFVTFVTFSSVLAHWATDGPHALHHKNTSVNFGAGLFIADKVFGSFARELPIR